MKWADTLALAVETPSPGIRVIRMSGELDRATVTRLGALVEKQMVHLEAERPVGHVVIDLHGVRLFGADGMETLLAVCSTGRGRGIELHLTGLAGREVLLPLRVTGLLAQFSTFPTVERAVLAITDVQ